jgi:heptosyltransferase-2
LETLKNILVIQTAFLGDAVLTLPMIEIIKNKFPSSNITVVTIPDTAELFRHSPFVDEVIEYDKKGNDKSLFSLKEFIGLIKSKRFDVVYTPHRSARSILITRFSGAKDTYGFDRAAFSFLLKNKIKYDDMIHEVARNLSLAGYNLEKNTWKIRPRITIPAEAVIRINKLVEQFPYSKIAVIAPGSVWKTKIYPKDYYFQITRFLIGKGIKIFMIGGKKDSYLCQEFEDRFEGYVKSYAGDLSIIESVALIKKSQLLICNDSAPTHLGMIAGTATLTLYCSTVKEFGFYPYLENSGYLSFDNLKCKPCGIHGLDSCPIKTFDCGLKLTPEMVNSKISEMLKL